MDKGNRGRLAGSRIFDLETVTIYKSFPKDIVAACVTSVPIQSDSTKVMRPKPPVRHRAVLGWGMQYAALGTIPSYDYRLAFFLSGMARLRVLLCQVRHYK